MPHAQSARLFIPAAAAATSAALALAAPESVAETAAPDATLSPHFYIPEGDPDVDELPLESTEVDIDISGVIAEVELVQTYENRGERPISARYVFPASTRAAVHGLEMTVGNDVIKAVVKERKQAQKEFEEAESEGKSASLLEQERPNVFTMNVANIMPGDEIEVALEYTELLVPTESVYELVFPTVVAPRYSEIPESGADRRDHFVNSPYRREREPPDYAFDLEATISTAMPLVDIDSPSHAITTERQGDSSARIQLDPSEQLGGQRDFILRYQLAGKRIRSGLLLQEGDHENFFTLMVEPPERVRPETIPPREYVFVVDNSGSMRGFAMDTAKTLIRHLTAHLRPEDRFNVILFAGSARVMAPRSLAATDENVERALNTLEKTRGGGGTRLKNALDKAIALPEAEGSSRNFVVVTDGLIRAEAEVFEQIRENLGDANVFSFGIGSSMNRHLIEGLARAGMGEAFALSEPEASTEVANRFIDYIRSPLLTDVCLDFGEFDAYDVTPRKIPDVLAERPIVVKGKWRGDPEGTLTLRGVTGKGGFRKRFDVGKTPVQTRKRGLSYLWARSRIAELSDFASRSDKKKLRAEVTDLGLRYNLLTEHTSFIAVHETIRKGEKSPERVDQSLPLAAGMQNTAVGGGLQRSPEPALPVVATLALVFAGAAIARRRGAAAHHRKG